MAHRTRALRHPAFWVALATLVVNDHLLKGAGVVPGWLTGKLSDFAGLIVAPVLLVTLLGLRREGARALAFGAVAFVFSILELSPIAAARWDAMLGAVGVPSRSWVDPTDLIALAVLPIAWWVVKAGDRAEPGRGVALASQRALMGAALFACLATSREPGPAAAPQWITDAWLHNRTAAPIDVRIRWIEGARDCDVLRSADLDLGAAAAPELFGEGITFRLEPGDTVPIEPFDARAAFMPSAGFVRAPLEAGESRNRCELALLSIDGLEDTVVFWSAAMERPVRANLLDLELGDEEIDVRSVVVDELSSSGTALRLFPGRDHEIAQLRDRPPTLPATCRETRGSTVAHSDLAHDRSVAWTVEYRALLPDGCTELQLIDELREATESLFLCVPEDFVPFAVGDEVTITTDTAGMLHVEAATESGLPELVLARGKHMIDLPGIHIGALVTDLGCADRLPCGAYVAPLAVSDGVGPEMFELDTAMEGTTPDGEPYRLIITRAERVVVAGPTCDAGRDRASALIDAVVLFERAPEMLDEGGIP